MQELPAGPALVDLISSAYPANLPVMLHGAHGIGKSTIMAAAAKKLGIEFVELDLSILEPPDLVGMPHVNGNGQTVYAPPAMLPTAGNGILMVEELNRSPRHMQGPCLQLLTARRLNSYLLPAGWLPCAAVNDGDDYLVEDLDAALLSRFLHILVVPHLQSWTEWALREGLHGKVVAFVRNPRVFDDPQANPRAWAYVSQFLHAWERGERHQEQLLVALSGLVGDKWAVSFLRTYAEQRQPLEPKEIIDAYPIHRGALKCWVRERKLDIVVASLEKLKQFLQPQMAYNGVVANATAKQNVEQFFNDLPPDIRVQVRTWLEDRGFDLLSAKVPKNGGKP